MILEHVTAQSVYLFFKMESSSGAETVSCSTTTGTAALVSSPPVN